MCVFLVQINAISIYLSNYHSSEMGVIRVNYYLSEYWNKKIFVANLLANKLFVINLFANELATNKKSWKWLWKWNKNYDVTRHIVICHNNNNSWPIYLRINKLVMNNLFVTNKLLVVRLNFTHLCHGYTFMSNVKYRNGHGQKTQGIL